MLINSGVAQKGACPAQTANETAAKKTHDPRPVLQLPFSFPHAERPESSKMFVRSFGRGLGCSYFRLGECFAHAEEARLRLSALQAAEEADGIMAASMSLNIRTLNHKP